VSVRDLYLQFATVIRPVLRFAPILGGVAILLWRVRETRVPVTARSLIIPPLGMSTGLGMFLVPAARVPWSWAIASLLFGALVLSWPLLRSSRLETRGDEVYMKRSRTFLWVLLGLFSVRLLLHDYIGHLISPMQTAAVFFLMAFGMIVVWRVTLLLSYRHVTAVSARVAAEDP
jgi:membrane protein CcdC involved in cytochrome C biogenesis